MRGDDRQKGAMWSYISPDQRVPADHRLREIREVVHAVLKDMSRPSIPPEHLLRALLLQVLYCVRSERETARDGRRPGRLLGNHAGRRQGIRHPRIRRGAAGSRDHAAHRSEGEAQRYRRPDDASRRLRDEPGEEEARRGDLRLAEDDRETQEDSTPTPSREAAAYEIERIAIDGQGARKSNSEPNLKTEANMGLDSPPRSRFSAAC